MLDAEKRAFTIPEVVIAILAIALVVLPAQYLFSTTTKLTVKPKYQSIALLMLADIQELLMISTTVAYKGKMLSDDYFSSGVELSLEEFKKAFDVKFPDFSMYPAPPGGYKIKFTLLKAESFGVVVPCIVVEISWQEGKKCKEVKTVVPAVVSPWQKL